MSKTTNESLDDFSDYNFDSFDDMDFGDGSDGPDGESLKNPSILRRIFTQVQDTAELRYQDSSLRRELLKSILPKQYHRSLTDLDDVSKEVDKTIKVAKDGWKQHEKEIKKLIKPYRDITDAIGLKRFGDWLESEERSRSSYDDSDEAREEMQVASILTEVFGDSGMMAKSHEESEIRADKRAEVIHNAVVKVVETTSVSNNILASINDAVHNLMGYNKQVTYIFQRKSIELSARQLITQTRMLRTMVDFKENAIKELQAIHTATALPDYMKATLQEQAKQAVTQKIVYGAASLFDGNASRIYQRVGEKVRSKLTEVWEEIGGALEMASVGDDIDEDEGNKSSLDLLRDKLIASGVNKGFDFAQNSAMKHISPKIRRLIDGQLKRMGVTGTSYNALMANFGRRANQMLREGHTGNDLLDAIISGFDLQDAAISTNLVVKDKEKFDLQKQATLDERYKLSITDVIPAWLQKIYREVHFTARKREAPNEVWDYQRNGWVEKDELRDRMREQVFNKDRIAKDLEAAANVVDTVFQNTFSPKARMYVIKHYIRAYNRGDAVDYLDLLTKKFVAPNDVKREVKMIVARMANLTRDQLDILSDSKGDWADLKQVRDMGSKNEKQIALDNLNGNQITRLTGIKTYQDEFIADLLQDPVRMKIALEEGYLVDRDGVISINENKWHDIYDLFEDKNYKTLKRFKGERDDGKVTYDLEDILDAKGNELEAKSSKFVANETKAKVRGMGHLSRTKRAQQLHDVEVGIKNGGVVEGVDYIDYKGKRYLPDDNLWTTAKKWFDEQRFRGISESDEEEITREYISLLDQIKEFEAMGITKSSRLGRDVWKRVEEINRLHPDIATKIGKYQTKNITPKRTPKPITRQRKAMEDAIGYLAQTIAKDVQNGDTTGLKNRLKRLQQNGRAIGWTVVNGLEKAGLKVPIHLKGIEVNKWEDDDFQYFIKVNQDYLGGTKARGGLIPRFAKGGLRSKDMRDGGHLEGNPEDAVITESHGGEFIVNQQATKVNRKLLEALNKYDAPLFKNGSISNVYKKVLGWKDSWDGPDGKALDASSKEMQNQMLGVLNNLMFTLPKAEQDSVKAQLEEARKANGGKLSIEDRLRIIGDAHNSLVDEIKQNPLKAAGSIYSSIRGNISGKLRDKFKDNKLATRGLDEFQALNSEVSSTAAMMRDDAKAFVSGKRRVLEEVRMNRSATIKVMEKHYKGNRDNPNYHPVDIYIVGNDKPILTANNFENGQYMDPYTGDIIRLPFQITHGVKDLDGNFILSLSDLVNKQFLYNAPGKGLVEFKFLRNNEHVQVYHNDKAMLQEMAGRIKSSQTLTKMQTQWTEFKQKWLTDEAVDVYTRDGVLALQAVKMERGAYINQETGDVLWSHHDITASSDIFDRELNKVVMTKATINRGLFDINGKHIQVRLWKQYRNAIFKRSKELWSNHLREPTIKIRNKVLNSMSALGERVIGSNYNRRPIDVYIAGAKTPIITAQMFKEGIVYDGPDASSAKRLKSHSDIGLFDVYVIHKGDKKGRIRLSTHQIVDEDGSVLLVDQYGEPLYLPLLLSATNRFKRYLSDAAFGKDGNFKALTLKERLFMSREKRIETIKARLEQNRAKLALDVYVVGKPQKPALTKSGFEEGRYVDANDPERVIWVPELIIGPVLDRNDNLTMVVSEDDLKAGLVDFRGRKINTNFDADKGGFWNNLKGSMSIFYRGIKRYDKGKKDNKEIDSLEDIWYFEELGSIGGSPIATKQDFVSGRIVQPDGSPIKTLSDLAEGAVLARDPKAFVIKPSDLRNGLLSTASGQRISGVSFLKGLKNKLTAKLFRQGSWFQQVSKRKEEKEKNKDQSKRAKDERDSKGSLFSWIPKLIGGMTIPLSLLGGGLASVYGYFTGGLTEAFMNGIKWLGGIMMLGGALKGLGGLVKWGGTKAMGVAGRMFATAARTGTGRAALAAGIGGGAVASFNYLQSIGSSQSNPFADDYRFSDFTTKVLSADKGSLNPEANKKEDSGSGIDPMTAAALASLIPGAGKVLWKGAKLLGKGLLGGGEWLAGKALSAVGATGKVGGNLAAGLGRGVLSTVVRSPGALATVGRIGLMAVGGISGVGLVLAAAGGAWWLYTKLRKSWNDASNPWNQFRLAQYGFDHNDKTALDKIANIEVIAEKLISVKNNGVTLKTDNKAMEEILKVVGIMKDNGEFVEGYHERLPAFSQWFKERFLRVFASYIQALVKIVGEGKMIDLKLLNKDQQLELFKQVHFTNPVSSPYIYTASPFDATAKTTVNGTQVDVIGRQLKNHLETLTNDKPPYIVKKTQEENKVTGKSPLENAGANKPPESLAKTPEQIQKEMLDKQLEQAKKSLSQSESMAEASAAVTKYSVDANKAVTDAQIKVTEIQTKAVDDMIMERLANFGKRVWEGTKSFVTSVGDMLGGGNTTDEVVTNTTPQGPLIGGGTGLSNTGTIGGEGATIKDGKVKVGTWVRDISHGGRAAQMQGVITAASNKFGVDPATMMAIANIESGFNHKIVGSTGTYRGLYQIHKDYLADWSNPTANAEWAAKNMAANKKRWEKEFPNIPFTGGIAYLMHQQGQAGAIALMKNPNASAAQILGKWHDGGAAGVARGVIANNMPGGKTNANVQRAMQMTAKEWAYFWITKGDALANAYKNGGAGTPAIRAPENKAPSIPSSKTGSSVKQALGQTTGPTIGGITNTGPNGVTFKSTPSSAAMTPPPSIARPNVSTVYNDKSSNPNGRYDFDKMFETLYKNVTKNYVAGGNKSPHKPISRCAYYVRLALDAADSNKKAHGGMGDAFEWKNTIPRRGGWSLVGEFRRGYKPQIGDLAVILGTRGGGIPENGAIGHVAIFTPRGEWVSDFIQSDKTSPAGRSEAIPKTSFLIYRCNDYKYSGKIVQAPKDQPMAKAPANTPKASNGVAEKSTPVQKVGNQFKTSAPEIATPNKQATPSTVKTSTKNVSTSSDGGVKLTGKLSELMNRATPELIALGKQHVTLQDKAVNIAGMKPEFMKLFYACVGECVKAGWKGRLQINSAHRTYAEQAALYRQYGPKRAARPGTSRHEFGVAIDISNNGILSAKDGPVNKWFATGIPKKWGFVQNLLYKKNGAIWEPWHIENLFVRKDGLKPTADILGGGDTSENKTQTTNKRQQPQSMNGSPGSGAGGNIGGIVSDVNRGNTTSSTSSGYSFPPNYNPRAGQQVYTNTQPQFDTSVLNKQLTVQESMLVELKLISKILTKTGATIEQQTSNNQSNLQEVQKTSMGNGLVTASLPDVKNLLSETMKTPVSVVKPS